MRTPTSVLWEVADAGLNCNEHRSSPSSDAIRLLCNPDVMTAVRSAVAIHRIATAARATNVTSISSESSAATPLVFGAGRVAGVLRQLPAVSTCDAAPLPHRPPPIRLRCSAANCPPTPTSAASGASEEGDGAILIIVHCSCSRCDCCFDWNLLACATVSSAERNAGSPPSRYHHHRFLRSEY